MDKPKPHDRNRTQGYSMIEVLVALTVLSIGLLGIAGLQATSKRSNFEALQRNTATLLAQEVMERVRANVAGFSTYVKAGAGNTLTGGTYALPAKICNTGTLCTTDELAAYDLYQIDQMVMGVAENTNAGTCTSATPGNCGGGLPSPTVCITIPAGGETTVSTATGAHLNVEVAWRGLTPLNDPTGTSMCGQGNAVYDFVDATGANQVGVLRRVMAIRSYLWDPVPK